MIADSDDDLEPELEVHRAEIEAILTVFENSALNILRSLDSMITTSDEMIKTLDCVSSERSRIQ